MPKAAIDEHGYTSGDEYDVRASSRHTIDRPMHPEAESHAVERRPQNEFPRGVSLPGGAHTTSHIRRARRWRSSFSRRRGNPVCGRLQHQS